ncbi:helix-turn-helix transcriptional regulator [Pseudonocardia sp. MH-G8]|uniref:helix-turn-helix domain-containing protein n=1 Tax=Pseudonocardia sp. MH-G8 TaxID=1854588 RepID=UPI00130436E7|nr:helix-turn-helix transcriptional regulator [Pseudonocardia sp. MH-G8]
MSTSQTGDELSRRLRDLRQTAGLTSIAAAEAAGIGQAALSRYENGRFVPTRARLEALLAAYRAPEEVAERLRAMVDDLRAENRRVVVHRKNAPAFQRRIRDIEATSEHVATFQPAVIPGILQTEAYMRVLTASADREVADGVIAARLERQKLLGQSGHRWTQLVTAGALLWCAGSAATMVEQIDRIIEISRLDGVRIGVIPARRPMTVFPLHGFDLYDERAVIVGTLATTAVITESADVRLHVDMFTALSEAADFGDGGRAALAEVRDGYVADAR